MQQSKNKTISSTDSKTNDKNKNKNKNNNTPNEKTYVYTMDGIEDSTKAKMKCLGFVENNQDFKDVELKINGESTMLEIYDDVFLKIYKCNISNGFLMKSTRIPMYCASVMYQRKFVKGYLFSIVLYFDMTTDTTTIKSHNELLNKDLEGEYTLEVELDHTFDVISSGETFAGQKQYIDNIINLVKTDGFKDLINIELKKRDEERIKKFGGNHSYTPPQVTVKFNELVEKYKKGESVYFKEVKKVKE